MKKIVLALIAAFVTLVFPGSVCTHMEVTSANYPHFCSFSLKQKFAYAATSDQELKEIYYVVKKGDTLWSIARTFSTTVANLKAWNKLSSDLIQIGQVICVRKGDTAVAPVTTKITPSKTTSSSRGESSEDILATAKRYLGVPYVYGGTTPSGFDCSGFVQYIFNIHGILLPRTASEQATVGIPVNLADASMGDLIFFCMHSSKHINHVGIYIGNGSFIHASSKKGITIDSLDGYYNNMLVAIRRVI